MFYFCFYVFSLAPCLGRLELIGLLPFPLCLPLGVTCLKKDRCREAFEKLNYKRKIWADRSVVLDEVDPAIWANLEFRGWLSLLEIDHPPLTALIKEFFLNISCHIYDSNTLVRSWIRGVEFTITSRIVAEALGVPVVREPVYPYEESPPLDDIMSYITESSIQWGTNPRITSTKLSETAYLFFRIACQSLWPISHLHTIPLKRCVFLYAFVSGASISFYHLFLRSLNKVHRSSVVAHALIHPFSFIGFFLFLGLDDFPAGEPVHIIAPIGGTFLRYKSAHLRVGPMRLRSASSGVGSPPPSSTGVDTAKVFGGAAADADVPPLTTSDDLDIRRMLDHVLTIQVAHG